MHRAPQPPNCRRCWSGQNLRSQRCWQSKALKRRIGERYLLDGAGGSDDFIAELQGAGGESHSLRGPLIAERASKIAAKRRRNLGKRQVRRRSSPEAISPAAERVLGKMRTSSLENESSVTGNLLNPRELSPNLAAPVKCETNGIPPPVTTQARSLASSLIRKPARKRSVLANNGRAGASDLGMRISTESRALRDQPKHCSVAVRATIESGPVKSVAHAKQACGRGDAVGARAECM